MIAFTREEAQQVLDALYSMNGTEFLCQAAHHPKKDMHKSGEVCPVAARYMEAREKLRARLSAPERNCTRSHPHENMGAMCELRTEIARLTNENARLKSQPEPEPVTDKYLMEVECTKCGAKQDGILTVNTPPQREWQGLTDEEANELCFASVEEIEAKLREKNT